MAAKLAGRVTATESDAAQAAKAGDVLARLGFGNVTVRTAAAADGDAANAPYDVIVLAGATEIVVRVWLTVTFTLLVTELVPSLTVTWNV